MIVGKSTVQKKDALTLMSIAMMSLSLIFFVASQVAQLAMSAELCLLTVTMGLSVASIILGFIVTPLSKKTTDKNFLSVYDSLWQRGPEVRSKFADSSFIIDSIYREE